MYDYLTFALVRVKKRYNFLHTLNMHCKINKQLKVLHFQKACTLYYSTI